MFVLRSKYKKELKKMNCLIEEKNKLQTSKERVDINFRELLSIVNPKGTFILKKESYKWFKEKYKEDLCKWYFKKLVDIKREDNYSWFYVEDGYPYDMFKLKILLISEEDFKEHFEVWVTYSNDRRVEHY